MVKRDWAIEADPTSPDVQRVFGDGDFIVHDVGGEIKGTHLDLYIGECGPRRDGPAMRSLAKLSEGWTNPMLKVRLKKVD